MSTAITTRRASDQQPTQQRASRRIADLLEPYKAVTEIHSRSLFKCSGPLLPDGVTRELVAWTRAALEAYARPATPEEVIKVMMRLRLHYQDWQHLDEDEAALVAEDWIEDLAGQSIGALIEGAALWRQSGAKAAPTAGMLLEKMGARRTANMMGPIQHLGWAMEGVEAAEQWFAMAQSGALLEPYQRHLQQKLEALRDAEVMAAKIEELEREGLQYDWRGNDYYKGRLPYARREVEDAQANLEGYAELVRERLEA